MKNAFVIAGIFALTTALGSTAALAQSSGGGGMAFSGAASGSASAQADAAIARRSFASADYVNGSLARADVTTGRHGIKARHAARIHGANNTGFCPPGQAKKPGSGSRFQC